MLKEGSKRRCLEHLDVWRRTETIDLGFEITRPLFSLELAVKALCVWLHSSTMYSRLPAPSELADRIHVRPQLPVMISRRAPQ